MIYLKFCGNVPEKKLETLRKKTNDPSGDHPTPPPPLRFDPYIYQLIALDVRIPNI